MEEKQNRFLVPLAIIVAGGLVCWGIISSNNKKAEIIGEATADKNTSIKQPLEEKQTQISVKETDYILGNPNAELMIISFNDFECPYCQIFHQTMKQIMDNYGKEGQVAWIFRQFPIYGASAREKAIGAKCAGQIGGNAKFWEFSDKVFGLAKNNQNTTIQLSEIAKLIGLDKTKFSECLTDGKIAGLVESEYQSGVNAGILGTPQNPGGTPYSFIITKSGKTTSLIGAQPYNSIKSIIDTLLKEEN